MKRGIRTLLCGSMLCCSTSAAAAQETGPRLAVSVNNLAGFDEQLLAEAGQVVTSAFRQAGVRLEWQGAPDPRVPAERRITINLVPNGPMAMGESDNVLGLSALPGSGRPGHLAWIFQPTLEKIVGNPQYLGVQSRRSILVAVVLGYVVSHELCHLLLGSTGHAGFGIMSLGWDPIRFALRIRAS